MLPQPPLDYRAVRDRSVALARGLSEADCQVQAMPEASPVKWHLAHTTWFFETFVLEAAEPGFKPFHPAYRVLFNSYYNGIGQQHPRAQRGLVTRPSLAEVLDYRRQVDERVAALQRRGCSAAIAARIELGLHHEQQHQELILTDLQQLLSCNPLDPVYDEAWDADAAEPADALAFVPLQPGPGGLVSIGHEGGAFAFDNETPRHAVHLRPYALAARLLTVGDWQAFVDDGGYRQPRWWLSAGWDWLRRDGIEAPLYWRRGGDASSTFTHRFGLQGLRPLRPGQTLWHVSLYEADAYARWRSAQGEGGPPLRLPTEAEWEHAAALAPAGLQQVQGRAWQWTSSAYAAYPGFAAWDGAVGEYNAKFMVDQYVLRGGSPATPPGHLRISYRNFFPAATRWQFSGVRLAHDRP